MLIATVLNFSDTFTKYTCLFPANYFYLECRFPAIPAELREIVREKFEDPNVIDKMLGTLRDSVNLVGDLFDVVRKKSTDGAKK